MDVYALADKHRADVLANDTAAKKRLIDAYAAADRDLQTRCAALMNLIEQRQAAGEEISRAWLQKEARYDALLRQVSERIKALAGLTSDETTRAVRANLQAGTRDALVLIEAASGRATVAGAVDRLNTKASENIAAYLAPDAPLGRLLARITEEMPRDAVKAAKEALIIGITTGQNPRVVARNFQAATGQSLTRSLTISRTEQLRAYRQASLQAYQDSDTITKYQWLSAKSARTCVACLAMDARVFEKDAPFLAHVRCRCTVVPVVGEPRPRQTGEEWLKAQDEATQDKVMGPAAAGAWRKGEVELRDFVGVRKNTEYGDSVYHDSLKGARERASQRAKKGIIKEGNDGRSGAKDVSYKPDRVYSPEERQALTPIIQRNLEAVEPLVSDAVGLVSNWSKRLEITDRDNERGSKPYECDIRISDWVAAKSDRWRTLIHEMLHAHSAGYTAEAYKEFRGWEEAVIEQTQRLIRDRVLSALPDDVRPAILPPVGDTVDREHTYNIYIAAMEQIRALLGDEPETFYFGLLKTPMAERKSGVMARIMQMPAEQKRAAAFGFAKPAGTLGRNLNQQLADNKEAIEAEARATGDVLYGKVEAN